MGRELHVHEEGKHFFVITLSALAADRRMVKFGLTLRFSAIWC
jgi:hypothetical protein